VNQSLLCRDHLTTRQDIHNVMQQYNLNLVQKHSEDATSINCCVKDLQDRTKTTTAYCAISRKV